MNKVCCFTGHRPERLNGYDPKDNKKLLWDLSRAIEYLITDCSYNVFISGMALGIDQWAAQIVLRLQREKYPHIKLICAIPCANHQNRWKQKDQDTWQAICDKAERVVYVSKEEYKPYLMQKRNEWMVDSSHLVLGVWDGTEGGTGNCIKYAQKVEKMIKIIDVNDYRETEPEPF